ncbi:hypothetical protein CRUP_030640 [Coryphaenoides rupestris]|nr:hypothetical protein CRUP_030640 [Coryphaenoides rupestris]
MCVCSRLRTCSDVGITGRSVFSSPVLSVCCTAHHHHHHLNTMKQHAVVRWWLLISSLLCLSSAASTHSDFFTSIGHMTDLVFTEKDLVTSLKDYIRAEESKLDKVKKWAEKMDALSVTATQDPDSFLGHPVNAYKLMKRLNTEWGELESLRQHFPNDDDQVGAAKALMRLQDTYKLDTQVIASGDLPGTSSMGSLKSALSVDDCFDLGKVAYSEADYYHTELWMSQALRQLQEGQETAGAANAVVILDYLSYSIYQQGELERALDFTKQLLELDSTHQRANGNLKYFEYQLAKQQAAEEAEGGAGREKREAETKGERGNADYLPERRKYEQLCRGESIKMTPRRQSRMFCRFFDNNRHPKYVIGPVKQEDEWDRPRILRYHDIVSDAEIELVKQLAKPRLRRATISNPITGVLETAHYRISKSAWLTAYEHEVVDKINQRIEDITGLDMSTGRGAADKYILFVANYGVGGQYEPHFDFGRMSDVSSGGATVFTDVGAAVWPKKGSAVFWYNLFPNGEGDYSTRHAACPCPTSGFMSEDRSSEGGVPSTRRPDLSSSSSPT